MEESKQIDRPLNWCRCVVIREVGGLGISVFAVLLRKGRIVMQTTIAALAAILFCTIGSGFGLDVITGEGTWPRSWPKELESLRKQSRTIESGDALRVFYEIPFTTRKDFESAWPHILKIRKSRGAPLILLRRPDNRFGLLINAGVRINAGERTESPPNANSNGTAEAIELVVDGGIVNLNRIPLPVDTPIIDKRFEGKENALKPSGD